MHVGSFLRRYLPLSLGLSALLMKGACRTTCVRHGMGVTSTEVPEPLGYTPFCQLLSVLVFTGPSKIPGAEQRRLRQVQQNRRAHHEAHSQTQGT